MENTNKRTYSRKRKKKEIKPAERDERSVENPISYGFWFTIALRDGRVQFWQDREIFVFFKNRGLTDTELRSKYDEMLKLY